MTTGLESKAHRLVELARAGDDPSASQLSSLHGAITARIAAESAAASGIAATKAASTGAFVKGLIVAGAIATGAAGFFAFHGAEPEHPVSAPAPLAKADPEEVEQVAPAPPPQPVAPSVEAPVLAPPNRIIKPTSSLRLQDEAALLAEVQGALRSGQASAALAKLESYDRRFPTGMLRAEADAARVFALCSAGRVEKSRAAATRFVQRYPSSPAAARVQAACK